MRRSSSTETPALDGIGGNLGRFYLWLPLAGLATLAVLYLTQRPLFYWMLREDRPVEWGQFALCVFTTVVAVLAGLRFARRGYWLPAAILIAVALVSLVLAGEEISWGQRAIGLATPADWGANNRQKETNFHNVNSVGAGLTADQISKVIELMIGLGGLTLSLLARHPRSRLGDRGWRLVMPPLVAAPAFAMMVAYQLMMLLLGVELSPAIVLQEWMELALYVSVALTLSCNFVSGGVPRPRPAGEDGPVPPAPVTETDRQALLGVATSVLLVTLVLAILTSLTGMVPGNVPTSLPRL